MIPHGCWLFIPIRVPWKSWIQGGHDIPWGAFHSNGIILCHNIVFHTMYVYRIYIYIYIHTLRYRLLWLVRTIKWPWPTHEPARWQLAYDEAYKTRVATLLERVSEEWGHQTEMYWDNLGSHIITT